MKRQYRYENNMIRMDGDEVIFLANICSCCGYPVIRNCFVTETGSIMLNTAAMGALGSALSGKASRQKEKLEKAAVELYNDAVRGIRDFELYTKTKGAKEPKYQLLGDRFSFGRDVSVYTEIKTDQCPFCGHIELWQQIVSQSDLKPLVPEQCRPVVYHTKQLAVEWAEKKAKEIDLQVQQFTETQRREAERQTVEMNELLGRVKTDLSNSPLKQRVAEANDEKWKAKKNLETSKLKFKKYKQTHEALTQAEEALAKAKDAWDAEREALEKKKREYLKLREQANQVLRGSCGTSRYLERGDAGTMVLLAKDGSVPVFDPEEKRL